MGINQYLIIAVLFAGINNLQATHVSVCPKKPAAHKKIDNSLSRSLLKAVDKGDVQAIKKLFDGDTIPDVNAKVALGGFTALAIAAYAGHTAVVAALINAGANVDAVNKDGSTALMLAAANGHADAVQILIDAGAHIDIREKGGFTALMLAAGSGNRVIVQALVEAGADPNIRNEKDDNKIARDYAQDKDAYDKAVIVGLVGRKKLTMEHQAQAKKKSEQAQAVEQVNQKLLEAARKGDIRTIFKLFTVDIKPDVNTRDPLGKTALMIAARRLNFEMVRLLLEHDADADLSDNDGYTALMEALTDTTKIKHKDQIEIIKKLLFVNFSIDAQTKRDGITALMLAVLHHNHDAAKILIENGAGVNLQTKQGVTALMTAAQEHDKKMVRILLLKGADRALQDKIGETAADYADGDLEVLDILAPSKEISEQLQKLGRPLRAVTRRGFVQF